ncbi:MAG: hypothetical protein DCC75_03805 [Proteobacteria bacterium]|nr:MAG: hypothetical protein DCC75_03805 [Pseudomonadota bacterium]
MFKSSLQKLLEDGLIWSAERKARPAAPNRAASCLPLPLAFGRIHEFFFPAKLIPTVCAVPVYAAEAALRQDPKLRCLWIGNESWPAPFAFRDLASLPQHLFIDPPSSKLRLWSIETALRAQTPLLVVAPCKKLNFAASKRLALAAKDSSSMAILLYSSEASFARAALPPSAAHSRWLLSPLADPAFESPAWKISLLKIKGEAPAVTEWILRRGELRQEGLETDLKPPFLGRRRAEKRLWKM